MAKVIFKELKSQQTELFPANLGDFIPANHPVRIVNQVVDSINIDHILANYKGGGASSFHPRMMIKVLFYSYLNNIYSCRKIEQALKENIYFMWISGKNMPDFRTINSFRGKRLQGAMDSLFTNIVLLMNKLNMVSLDEQYIDGTKIESASNRYTFVWRGSVEKNKKKLEDKIQCVLTTINQAIKEDNKAAAQPEAKLEISSQELKEQIDELNQRLDQLNKKQRKAVEKLEKEALPRLEKYEQQTQILGDRNSFSKTDEDATFMRMKEDHMKNGQLKPAYNIQISTENQCITCLSIHQRPGDTATMKLHLEKFKNQYKKQSKKAIADAGYGSEENYEYMEQNDIEAFVKYNYFHKEQKRKFRKDIFHPENMYYNAEKDYFICPMGQQMRCVGKSIRRSELGYTAHINHYQAQRCEGCPLHSGCHKSKGNRKIEINHNLRRLKKQARERLLSPEGIAYRRKRAIEPEAVFGQIKSNNKFNRFRLRGLIKVEIDFGLAAIAHNLKKIAKFIKQGKNKHQIQQLIAIFKQLHNLLIRYMQPDSQESSIIKFTWGNSGKNISPLRLAA